MSVKRTHQRKKKVREFYCPNCKATFSEFEQTHNEYDNGICPSCGEYIIVETNGINVLVKYPNMPLTMKMKLFARMINRGSDCELKLLAEQCGLFHFLKRDKFRKLQLSKWR
jgi:predicted RNA-binding Zn-ribbon protein involved in translation (DUF1610 family)